MPKDRLLSVLNLTGLQDARSYSADDVKKLASLQVGRYLLSGSFFKSGETFQVHTTIQDSHSGKVVSVLSDECPGEAGLIGLVDSLSPEIKGALEISEAKIAADIDRSLGEVTTSSPEALRLLNEGTGSYVKSNYSQAIDLLKKAVEINPDFAMAHRQFSALYGNRGQRAESAEHVQKALALKDRVSERERLIIEGQDCYFKRQWEGLFLVATRLLERWPEDIPGNRLLSIAYGDLGDQESAFKYAERGFRLYPESAVECANLADGYWTFNEFDKAEKMLLAYSKDFPDSAVVHGYLGWHYCMIGDFDKALKELDIRQRLDPKRDLSDLRRIIYFVKGDLTAFSQELDKLFKSESASDQLRGMVVSSLTPWIGGRRIEAKNIMKDFLARARKDEKTKQQRGNLSGVHLKLAELSLNLGEFQDALNESGETLREAVSDKNRWYQMTALVLKGRAFLGLKSLAEAQQTAAELLAILKDEKEKREMRAYHLLEGLIELERGNLKKAVEFLEKAESLLLNHYGMSWDYEDMADIALYLDATAQAYYKSGKMSQAKEKYEKISSTGLFRFHPDIRVRSFYWLGRIAEDRGKKAEARGHYEKFLDLWKDADPGIPEVEDARKRLAGLQRR